MKLSILSSIALAAAMTVSGAMAQTMVAGVDVSAEDLPKVQAQCDALVAKAAAEDTASDSTAAETTAEPVEPAAPQTSDPAATDATGAAGIDAATTTSIDLDTLTLEQCKEAGLVQ